MRNAKVFPMRNRCGAGSPARACPRTVLYCNGAGCEAIQRQRVKRPRPYPSSIVILAAVVAATVLLLMRWPVIPEGAGNGRSYPPAELLPVREENALARINATANPLEWVHGAFDLAKTYVALEQYREAEALLTKIPAVAEKMRPNTRSLELEVEILGHLGCVYAQTDRHPEALSALQQELARCEKNAYYTEQAGWILAGMARSYDALGNRDAAVAHMERALENRVRDSRRIGTVRVVRPAQGLTSQDGGPKSKTDRPFAVWIEEYRALLAKTGRTPQEIEQVIEEQFGPFDDSGQKKEAGG